MPPTAAVKAAPLLKPGIYRYYEGTRECKVVAITTDAETGEEIAVYQEQFGMFSWKVEPLRIAADEFFYRVKDKNYHGPRYKLVKEF